MAGVFTLTGSTGTVPGGQGTLQPQTIPGNIAIGEILPIALASGDNTIVVPLGSVGVTVVPPIGNTTAIKVRTSLNPSDGGTSINPGNGFYSYMFPSTAPTTVILNAGSSIGQFTQVWFI